MTNISGCEYHDLLLAAKFNLDIQYVGVTTNIMLIGQYADYLIREKR
jgi:hypothetical protein